VEEDPALAAVARALFENYPNVRVLHGGWENLLRYRPFGLLCTNIKNILPEVYELLFQAIRPGGVLVLSGLQPQKELPIEMQSDEPDECVTFG
jgi:protein-L-isoaspartate O-methyltransferase